jgi:hypothetical protein
MHRLTIRWLVSGSSRKDLLKSCSQGVVHKTLWKHVETVDNSAVAH